MFNDQPTKGYGRFEMLAKDLSTKFDVTLTMEYLESNSLLNLRSSNVDDLKFQIAEW